MLEMGVIGAGNWGKNLVRNFDALPDVHLRYVSDLDDALREKMAGLYPDCTVTGEVEQVLSDPDLDAVVIAVNSDQHHKVAKAALQEKKHVYVEKPLALSVEQARDLTETAAEVDRKLMVGHLLEYHPAVEYMKAAIADGTVGDPLYLYCHRVNLGIVRSTENAWWSLAPHDISVACFLFDAEPVNVSACGQDYLQDGIEDVVFASLTFADGRMAHIHVSWLDPHKIRKITLVGSDKMAVFDDMEASEKVRLYDKGADVEGSVTSYAQAITLRSGDILIPSISNDEPLRLECQHFVDSILQNTSPRSDGEDGLRVVKILQAGSKSLAQGGAPVSV